MQNYRTTGLRVSTYALVALLFITYHSTCARAQNVPGELKTGYAPLDAKLAKMVTVDSLALSPAAARDLPDAVFLDAREAEEYAVSHLPGALHVGYKRPDFSALEGLDPNRPLVVYCTVGYRSERLAADLRERGFGRVYNLYGSLFAWTLAGYPLEDAAGPTDRVHTYNRKWGELLPDGGNVKVW